VGQVARFLEERGFSTVILTPTPEYHRKIGFPRVAAIAHPYGRVVGEVHDSRGQRAVLIEVLSVFEKAKRAGEVYHLPFTWPEEPKDTKWHPPEMSPMVKLLLDKIRKTRKEAGSA
jgi:hypothetical protein